MAQRRLEYVRNYPITANHERESDFEVKVATEIAGQGKVVADVPSIMAVEDFAFMLEARIAPVNAALRRFRARRSAYAY